MKGYSKINTMSHLVESSRDKSRSIDFSSLDLPNTFPEQTPESNNTGNGNVDKFSTKKADKEEEEEMDHRKGGVEVTMNPVAVLRRNSSVKPSPTVKRGWSMRRSSSVTERYSRIYDHSVTLASPDDIVEEEEEVATRTRSGSGNKKKHIKIFKTCKRLFGL